MNKFHSFLILFGSILCMTASVAAAEPNTRIIEQFELQEIFTDIMGANVPEHIEEIHVANLFELYSLAKVSDLLITDRLEIAGTLADLVVNQIYLGTKFDSGSLRCIELNNIINLKNIIHDILNK